MSPWWDRIRGHLPSVVFSPRVNPVQAQEQHKQTQNEGILQSSSWKEERKKDGAKLCPTLAMPWTVARQAPLSMDFSRQEYWSGEPFL